MPVEDQALTEQLLLTASEIASQKLKRLARFNGSTACYGMLCKALRGLLQSIPADLDTVDKRANLKFQC